MATTSLLGYHAPSFTYGTDLILPAEVNSMLRKLLLSAAAHRFEGRNLDDEQVEFEIIREYMDVMNTTSNLLDKSFMPEVRRAVEMIAVVET